MRSTSARTAWRAGRFEWTSERTARRIRRPNGVGLFQVLNTVRGRGGNPDIGTRPTSSIWRSLSPIGVPWRPKKFFDGYHWMPEGPVFRAEETLLHPLPAAGTIRHPNDVGRCAMRT